MLNTISPSGTPPKPRLSLWAKPYQILRMDWLSRASTLPGKSLAVALALLHAANLRKTSTVVLNRRVLSLFAISPDAGYEALTRLAEARLIRAHRGRGRPPEVTLLDLKGQVMVMWLDGRERVSQTS